MAARTIPPHVSILVTLSLAVAGCSADPNGVAEQPVSECPGSMCGILAAHNAVRAAAPNANPVLSDLVWDETLAGHAQAWADTCPSGHNPNRSVGGQVVGENMFFTSVDGAVSPQSVVDEWASESSDYDIVTNTCQGAAPSGSNLGCGHYTQVVWRETTAVGCGVQVLCGGSLPQIWVCDYAPAGNIISGGEIRAPY